VLEVNTISKSYGQNSVLENVSLRLGPSSIWGVAGSNGAGKTTLLKIMAGVYAPDHGQMLLCGANVYYEAAARAQIVLVPDEAYFPKQATIQDMCRLYRGFCPGWSDMLVRRLAGALDLDERQRILRLSKGMQRKAAIMLALACRPAVLLLDELFDGLDPASRKTVRALILELIADRETCVVISSHSLRELEDLCDHLAVINHRHFIREGAVDEITAGMARYHVVLPENATDSHFAAIPASGLVCSGPAATFIAQSGSSQVDDQIKRLKPLLVERFPLSLEEFFLLETEETQHDFTGLFG
jgi:ABC-2 type transport system ATP-binding protein